MSTMKLRSIFIWVRVLLGTTLLLNIFALALPQSEHFTSGREPIAHAVAIRDDQFQGGLGKNAPGSTPESQLQDKTTGPDETPNGSPSKQKPNGVDKTPNGSPSGQKPNGVDKTPNGSPSGQKPNGVDKTPNGSPSGQKPNGVDKTPNGSPSGQKPNGVDKTPNGSPSGQKPNGLDKTPNGSPSGQKPNGLDEKKGTGNAPASGIHIHPVTHMTAEEAVRGGTLEKTATMDFGPGEPEVSRNKPQDLGGFTGPTDPCEMNFEKTEVDFVGPTTANLVSGNLHEISDVLCPPGGITHSYTFSTSWTVGGTLGPDVKDWIPQSNALTKKLDKFAVKFNVAYSWGNSQTTTYGATELGEQAHPFVLTYRPKSLIVNGNIKKTTYVTPFKQKVVCQTETFPKITMHLPIHTNDDCTGKSAACGPSVAWDHCFFLGRYARDLCPDRPLGPTPARGRQCPASFYPKEYRSGRGITS